MKNKYSLLLLVIVGAVLVAVSCAPTPTPVPTPVLTKAPPPTAVPMPTTVPPTATQPPPAVPTVAPTTVPTTAPTTASTSSASPTKAVAAGAATLVPTKATPVLPTGTPKTADDLLEITPESLKAMIEGGADIVVVDDQSPEEYAMGHIKGAINLPWDVKIKSANGLSTTKLAVLYCACSPTSKPSESDAGDVAFQLVSRFGYKKVAVLQGGWLRWQQLGYPIEKGK